MRAEKSLARLLRVPLVQDSRTGRTDRRYLVYEVYYRNNGKRKTVLTFSREAAEDERDRIISRKKKFLGLRPVTLQEVR